MSKKRKNISFPALVKEAEKLFYGHQKNDIRFFDVPSNWMPVPHDIQISLSHLRHESTENRPSAFHHRFVLKIHLSGISCGYVEANRYIFKPGEGILVFPFQYHRIINVPEKEGQFRLLANFSLDQQDQNAMEVLRDHLLYFTEDDMPLIRRMLHHAAGKSDEDYRESVFALSSLLVRLLKKTSGGSQEKHLFSPSIRSAFDYIYQHYRERITVKEAAEALGYSETGFRKAFLRETGQTPGYFMQELRLKDAAAQLRSTKLPVQEISRLAGFSNPYSFSRAFRSRFKMSPVEFRKN